MSAQTKPIVLVYLNPSIVNRDIKWIESMQKMLAEQWQDYHVMCIPDMNQKKVMQIQTWYDRDVREENFRAFEKHVLDILGKQKV